MSLVGPKMKCFASDQLIAKRSSCMAKEVAVRC